LQVKQDFPLRPKLLQPVKIAPVWGKKVQDHITKISQQPTVAWIAFHPPAQIMCFASLFNGSLGQCIQHAVTTARTNDKEICKDGDPPDVEQDNIFPLLFL
jgi:hypothetical protein